ncbi:MAG: thioesterase family protein [Candidatus Melainabacteria bacterium]|nr:thioesterase family protein [Candidatus Melainabacteria bacterium]
MPNTTRTRCFEVTKEISIGTYDIDFAGHVSNIVYLRWMEDMRLMIFDKHFPLQGFMEQGLLPVLAATSIEYRKAIRLFDKPVGHMWIQEVRPASVIFGGEVVLDGAVTTTVTHTGVFVSATTMKPVRIPKVIVAKYLEQPKQ